MTEQMKAYANYPHLTINDIVILEDLKDRIERTEKHISELKRTNNDWRTLDDKKRMLIRKRTKILGNLIEPKISGMPKKLWADFGKKVGNNNRSAKIVEMVSELVKYKKHL